MEDKRNVGGRDRIVRLLLTVVLSIVAVTSLRRGKRLRGLLAGVGALGFGFTSTTGYCGVNDALGVDTTTGGEAEPDTASDDGDAAESDTASEDADATESHSLYCAACGEPIVPGESRGPNDADEIVHDACA